MGVQVPPPAPNPQNRALPNRDGPFVERSPPFSCMWRLGSGPNCAVEPQRPGGPYRNQFPRARRTTLCRPSSRTTSTRVHRNQARDGGTLLHCQGRPESSQKTLSEPWMRSIEFQVIAGATGDIMTIRWLPGEQRARASLAESPQPEGSYWRNGV